jgi:bacterial/archaeal transporter family-2 protein
VDSKVVAVIAMAAAGGLVGMQAPINSGLGKAIGNLPAATVSFTVGLCALVGITLVSGEGFGRLGEIGGVSWYYLIGGLLGAVWVATALVVVRTLGAGGVTAATIAGQLTMAVVIDRIGIFGLEQRGLTAGRLLGIALLVAGVFLIVQD